MMVASKGASQLVCVFDINELDKLVASMDIFTVAPPHLFAWRLFSTHPITLEQHMRQVIHVSGSCMVSGSCCATEVREIE